MRKVFNSYWQAVVHEVVHKKNKKLEARFFFTRYHPQPEHSPDFVAYRSYDRKTIKRYYLGERHPNIYFSQREVECLSLCLKNLSNPQIGKKMGLSSRTIEFYLKNIKQKVSCGSKSQLIAWASEANFDFLSL